MVVENQGADANQGNRPLSPHLQIYRPQITSVLSILNRITGIGMALAMVLITWWFLAAATNPGYFDVADGFLTSWFGMLILVASLWAFWFHFFNGLRHLRWDAVKGMGMKTVRRSGWIALVLSVVATVLCVIWAM
ncbi:MAG: succinate dehydrogenase, cytochrome b556 subunit [Marinosulfonomonas sp.]|nr:succinate dehydrogenase, cytochrome b556 subunit [Marinosulfonomonas sp.]